MYMYREREKKREREREREGEREGERRERERESSHNEKKNTYLKNILDSRLYQFITFIFLLKPYIYIYTFLSLICIVTFIMFISYLFQKVSHLKVLC